MQNVYTRLAVYALLPILGAGAAGLATMIDGIGYDATTHTVTIGLEQVIAGVSGLVLGAVSNIAVFKKWGVR